MKTIIFALISAAAIAGGNGGNGGTSNNGNGNGNTDALPEGKQLVVAECHFVLEEGGDELGYALLDQYREVDSDGNVTKTWHTASKTFFWGLDAETDYVFSLRDIPPEEGTTTNTNGNGNGNAGGNGNGNGGGSRGPQGGNHANQNGLNHMNQNALNNLLPSCTGCGCGDLIAYLGEADADGNVTGIFTTTDKGTKKVNNFAWLDRALEVSFDLFDTTETGQLGKDLVVKKGNDIVRCCTLAGTPQTSKAYLNEQNQYWKDLTQAMDDPDL